jgi:SAM-dependent methyltransferase
MDGVQVTAAHPDLGQSDLRRLQVHRQPPRRDVPYVPTDEAVVMAMLRFAGAGPNDIVYDLGCGDGRIVIAAARHCGARGVGVDIDPMRITECRENAARARVSDRVRFLCQSFFDTDLRDASVVMLYLLPSINIKLRPKLLAELRPGSRIIANHFEIGDWKPDMSAEAHHRTLRQWLVPGRVAGTWRCVVNDPAGRYHLTLRLNARYQGLTGSARIGRSDVSIVNGRLFGEHMTFKLIDWNRNSTRWFSARVEGRFLRGTTYADAIGGSPIAWGGIRAGS